MPFRNEALSIYDIKERITKRQEVRMEGFGSQDSLSYGLYPCV